MRLLLVLSVILPATAFATFSRLIEKTPAGRPVSQIDSALLDVKTQLPQQRSCEGLLDPQKAANQIAASILLDRAYRDLKLLISDGLLEAPQTPADLINRIVVARALQSNKFVFFLRIGEKRENLALENLLFFDPSQGNASLKHGFLFAHHAIVYVEGCNCYVSPVKDLDQRDYQIYQPAGLIENYVLGDRTQLRLNFNLGKTSGASSIDLRNPLSLQQLDEDGHPLSAPRQVQVQQISASGIF
jgi:hypothetical protein